MQEQSIPLRREMDSAAYQQKEMEGINAMAFVNEYVSAVDVDKYGLAEINRQFWKSDTRYDWTIDRQRDIYLRLMKSGRGEYGQQQEFTFYWHQRVLAVRLSRDSGIAEDGRIASIWRLHHLVLPGALQSQRQAILDDLKLALEAYKTAGVGSSVNEHIAHFLF